jgi:hypothetical protein
MDERTNLLRDPRTRTIGRSLYFLVVYFLLGLLFYFAPQYLFADPGISDQYVNYNLHLLADGAICLVGTGIWLVFFAQFVLPVKTFGDRLKVVDRLVTYLLGGHGPALFVENGIVRAREGETKLKGPGVIWMDSASAAVLRTGVKFTRTIGPGVHFTEANEFIAATTDLHQLSQVVGPVDDDKDDRDPFKVTKEKAPDDFEAIQKRRWETSAMTRDGIEVLATISVGFRITAKEGEGNTRFGFNKENAEKAIRDSLTRSALPDQPVWSELPAKMAVDVWREYVRKFRLSELFDTADDRLETGIQTIGAIVGKRLKQKEVEQLDEFGRVVLKTAEACKKVFNAHISEGRYIDIQGQVEKYTASDEFTWQGVYSFLLKNNKAKDAEEYLEKADSQEFGKLSGMGLEIASVIIKRVIFAPDIEERLMSLWTTSWKKNAEKERDQVERDRKLAETAGQEDALREYATEATREFKNEPPPNVFDALYYLVHSTFLGVRRNSALLKRTNTEQRELSDIFSWLRDRGARP